MDKKIISTRNYIEIMAQSLQQQRLQQGKDDRQRRPAQGDQG